MVFVNDATLRRMREMYPAGTLVELLQMDDPQAPPIGTIGTVTGVDDAGSILVKWDTGSGLNVAYGADRVRKLIMTDKVHQQMLAIRDGGLTNMFDTATVQRLAYDAGYFELVTYIEKHQKEYCCFIMTGKED